MRSIQNLMNLSGRVALITGGAGHIGSVMGESLAEAGADIIVVDFVKEAADDICYDLHKRYGVRAEAILIDLENEAEIRSIAPRVEELFGHLDILINCAALVGTTPLEGWGVPFLQQSSDTWRRALDINVTAPFILTQTLTPLLKQSKNGSIINIGSIYGVLGPQMALYEDTEMGNPSAYAASKGALIQLTRWLATNLAPDIRANAISLGGVWRKQNKQFVERYTSRTPLGRMATEEDLKGAVLYLASDLSRYVTGHNLMVDGGWSIW